MSQEQRSVEYVMRLSNIIKDIPTTKDIRAILDRSEVPFRVWLNVELNILKDEIHKFDDESVRERQVWRAYSVRRSVLLLRALRQVKDEFPEFNITSDLDAAIGVYNEAMEMKHSEFL